MPKTNESNVLTEKYIPQMKVEVSASSIIGTRKYQQDSYGYADTDKGCLAIVCDGMGGLAGGERASALGVRTMLEDFIRTPFSDAPAFLKQEAEKIDEMVFLLRDENGRQLGAGTTMVAVYIKDDKLNFISVGDSKIYILRSHIMSCLVREHNYRLILDEQLRRGGISREDYARESVQAEALISYLGIGDLSLIDSNQEPLTLYPGDVILLCSDGVYKTLSEDMIHAVLEDNYFDSDRAAEELTSSAMRYAGRSQDNTTAVLVRCI